MWIDLYSSFRHLDSPADSDKDRMTINKAVIMIRKAPVHDLMKKLHKKQEEIIPSIEPPFCGRQLLKFINLCPFASVLERSICIAIKSNQWQREQHRKQTHYRQCGAHAWVHVAREEVAPPVYWGGGSI